MNMLHVCGPTCSDLPQHSSLEIYGGKRAYSTVLRKRNIFIQGQAFPFVHQWRLLRQWTLPWKFAPVFHLNRDSESFVLVIWCVLQCAAVCCSVSPWFRDIHLGNLSRPEMQPFLWIPEFPKISTDLISGKKLSRHASNRRRLATSRLKIILKNKWVKSLMIWWSWYGVATISRLLKIIGLFCRISSLL